MRQPQACAKQLTGSDVIALLNPSTRWRGSMRRQGMDLSRVSIWGRILRTLGLTVPLLAAFLYQACGGNHSTSTVTVNPTPSPSPSQIDVITYHYDNARTGANLSEMVLTPANVNATKFGKIGFYAVDGKVDGQPVYLSQVSISGQGPHNLLYVVSEHASVYAFDADSGATLWHVSLLGSGETPSDQHNCGQIAPEIGITSTPVIDRSRPPPRCPLHRSHVQERNWQLLPANSCFRHHHRS